MGGAFFIAISDDATSASWNPGGLIQMHKAQTTIRILTRSLNADCPLFKFEPVDVG